MTRMKVHVFLDSTHVRQSPRIQIPTTTIVISSYSPFLSDSSFVRMTDDKNKDMDHHALHPSDYEAGRDSMCEEVCQQVPEQLTIRANGVSSNSGRLVTVKDPLNSGGVQVYF